MSKFATAIFAAEQISTRKEKFEALSGFGCDEKKLLWETYNPYRVFGVRKYDMPDTFATTDSSFQPFFQLLESLAVRAITGNAARLAVTSTLGMYTKETALALARVLNKDLECGASKDSFLKIYPDLFIPKFDLMLAGKIEENTKNLTTDILSKKYGLTFPLIADSKYDGNRLVAFVRKKGHGLWDVEFLSRQGKPSTQYNQQIVDELVELAKHVNDDIVVDGEILARSFQETMNAKGSDNTDAKNALNFYVFDWMFVSEWEQNSCSGKQIDRANSLKRMVEVLDLKKIIKSKSKICNDIQELREFYSEVLDEGRNPDGTLNGLGEGLIIKDINGFYEWDRSKVIIDRKTKTVTKPIYWAKWKPVIDLDLEFIGWEYGSGRLAKTVGRIHLRGHDENGTLIEAWCGSGLTDEMREFILTNHAKLLGKIVCIEAQEICLAEDSDTHSARFPVFICFRSDKS